MQIGFFYIRVMTLTFFWCLSINVQTELEGSVNMFLWFRIFYFMLCIKHFWFQCLYSDYDFEQSCQFSMFSCFGMKHWVKNKSKLSSNKWGAILCLAPKNVSVCLKQSRLHCNYLKSHHMIWLLIKLVSCDSPVAVTHSFGACTKRVSEEHEAVKADGEQTHYFMTYNKCERGVEQMVS